MKPAAWVVDQMIQRSVRARFRNVYWHNAEPVQPPAILYGNHVGWMDGYIMYLAMKTLELPTLAWIESFDEFPLFRTLGGLPFASGDKAQRLGTIRKSIRLLRDGSHTLFLFPEGVLHRPGSLLEFKPGLEFMAKAVKGLRFIPFALRYEMSIHERPEAWLSIGASHEFDSMSACRDRVQSLLDAPTNQDSFEVMFKGTPSVNERLGFSRRKG